MPPFAHLSLFCGAILLASLAGGWIPMTIRLTHTRLQIATSFVSGLMLGIGILHLMPHAWLQLQDIDRTAIWLVMGFMVMFIIQRFFHFHHHDVPEEAPETASHGESSLRGAEAAGGAEAAHDHGKQPHHTLAEKSARHLSWAGAAAGLTLHSLINGVALAASVSAESGVEAGTAAAGLGTFLVIFLHKPFDAMTIGTLMTVGGWSKSARHLVNALFALAIPLGAGLFYIGISQFAEDSSAFLGAALAFSAGTFLCIAASDLLPELQFHAHDRFKLSAALVGGVALSIAVGRFEHRGHEHGELAPTKRPVDAERIVEQNSNPLKRGDP